MMNKEQKKKYITKMINQFAFIPNVTTEEMRMRPEIVEKVRKINKIRFDKSERLVAEGEFPLDPYEFLSCRIILLIFFYRAGSSS